MQSWSRWLLVTLWAAGISCGEKTPPTSSFALPAPPVQSTYQPTRKDDPGKKGILFLGDSLTAGYGIDAVQAFPSLIQEKIDETGLEYRVINAGISGDTTSSGVRRVDWLLKSRVDVLFLELGANDGLRGISLDLTKKNLQNIVNRVRLRFPDSKVVIAGMMVPPNMGPEYSSGFQAVFRELAEENSATLIPFLLEGVAGRADLNQADGIHPTEQGHQIVADLVWTYLKPLLAPEDNVQE